MWFARNKGRGSIQPWSTEGPEARPFFQFGGRPRFFLVRFGEGLSVEPVSVSNRFSPLHADREAVDARDDQRHEFDTESLVSMNGSEGLELGEAVEEVVVEELLVAEFRVSDVFREALVSLDEIHLET